VVAALISPRDIRVDAVQEGVGVAVFVLDGLPGIYFNVFVDSALLV